MYLRSFSPAYQCKRLNGDLYYYHNRHKDDTRCVVFIVGGSGHSSALYTLARFEPLMRNLHADIYMLQKRRVRNRETGMGKTRSAFVHDYYFTQMTADQQYFIQTILSTNKDKKILLLGVSEGATVAAKLAVDIPQINYLVLIGGGGMKQADELKLLYPTQAQNLELLYKQIAASPQSTDSVTIGYSYKYWSDILFRDPMSYLLKLNIPIITGNGTDDQSTPAASAILVDSTFKALHKSNLRCIMYPHTDHTLKDDKGKSHLPDFFDEVKKMVE